MIVKRNLAAPAAEHQAATTALNKTGGSPAALEAPDAPGAAGSSANGPAQATRDDVQITLAALGYEPLEINRALRAVGQQGLEPTLGADAWLKESLVWLAQQAA